MELYDVIYNICQGARNASRSLANSSGKDRNKILLCMAEKIRASYEEIIEANKIDLANAKENGIKDAMLDRLMLNKDRIYAISDAICYVAGLSDPIGVGEIFTRPNGLEIHKTRVPLGFVRATDVSKPDTEPVASTTTSYFGAISISFKMAVSTPCAAAISSLF